VAIDCAFDRVHDHQAETITMSRPESGATHFAAADRAARSLTRECPDKCGRRLEQALPMAVPFQAFRPGQNAPAETKPAGDVIKRADRLAIGSERRHNVGLVGHFDSSSHRVCKRCGSDRELELSGRTPGTAQNISEVAMSAILVTGGSGFIGSHCILQLLAASPQVRATVQSLGLRSPSVHGERTESVFYGQTIVNKSKTEGHAGITPHGLCETVRPSPPEIPSRGA
jgi:hypothetical protein